MGNEPVEVSAESTAGRPHLPPHHGLKLVLVEPEIPQNAGNIARLCAVTGVELHLVRPLGFILSDRHLKRAGMDYLTRVKLVVHDDLAALQAILHGGAPMPAPGGQASAGEKTGEKTAFAGGPARYWLATSKSHNSLWDIEFAPGDWLILGKETAGLPPTWLTAAPPRTVAIPMGDGERCLNVSTSAGILVYEALRQIARTAKMAGNSYP